jgi:RNA polymerase sigma-70 factor (ECF subfamily)
MKTDYKKFKDAELVARIKKGNHPAMEEIVRRYSQKVYNLAYHLTKDKSAAEEILQNVFLTVISKIHTLREDSYFSTWLYRVTANASYGFLRRLTRDKKTTDKVAPHELDRESMFYDWAELPEDVLLSDESKTIITDALDELPGSMRSVVIMKDVEGLKNEEIADALGLSLPAVKSRLHRARLLLRERLSDYFRRYAHEGVH